MLYSITPILGKLKCGAHIYCNVRDSVSVKLREVGLLNNKIC